MMIVPLGAQNLTLGDENRTAAPALIAHEINMTLNRASGACTTFLRVIFEVLPSTVVCNYIVPCPNPGVFPKLEMGGPPRTGLFQLINQKKTG